MADGAVLLAGGSGTRMRGRVKDKVLAPLFGMPVILHAFKAFLRSGAVAEIVFVCRDDAQMSKIKSELRRHFPKSSGKLSVSYAYGGKERADSVINGLEALSDRRGLAFIHDGARPMPGVENIVKLGEIARRDGAAVLASRVVDTVKRLLKQSPSLSKCELEDLDRSRLWAMQTPQVFRAGAILRAYKTARRSKLTPTDDVAAASLAGIAVSILENESSNPKITVPEDLAYVEFLKKGKR